MANVALELAEIQGAIVQGRWKTKAVFHQHLFSRSVTVIHTSNLGDGHVRLVNDEQEVVREVIYERPGWASRGASSKMAGVVLDAGTIARFSQHLDIVVGASLQTLRLQQLPLRLELGEPLLQLPLDIGDGGHQLLAGGDEVLGRINLDLISFHQQLACQGVDLGNTLDLFSPELHPDGDILIGRLNLQGVTSDTEPAAGEIDIISFVLHFHQSPGNPVSVRPFSFTEVDHEAVVFLGGTQPVDAGDRGGDDHIVPAEQRAGGRVTELIDLFVDVGFLFDVGIGAWDVGLGLVVIVVADEVFHGVVGEELAELGAKLCCQGLVVRENQGGFLHLGDDIGDGEGLARSGYAEQDLMLVPVPEPGDELLDRLGLIAGGVEVGGKFKFGHSLAPCFALLHSFYSRSTSSAIPILSTLRGT
ncbi:MAG: hypothetical protein DDT28_00803 [Dehalococcoidia bacterium]|nr:hypothetical protein [Chloroflexota bacterium]